VQNHISGTYALYPALRAQTALAANEPCIVSLRDSTPGR
jgi:hypothetical protein